MRLLFKQRFFSWFDSYDIFVESGAIIYSVEGKLSWGHCLHINDAKGNHIGTVKQVILAFPPKFEIYIGDNYRGCISKELSFFVPRYHIDCNGWEVEGNFMEWDYNIIDDSLQTVATVTKELFNFTDTYSINVLDANNALLVLMVVLAIDAEKCSRN